MTRPEDIKIKITAPKPRDDGQNTMYGRYRGSRSAAASRLADADAVTDSPVSVLAVIKSARRRAKRLKEPVAIHIHIAATSGEIASAALADELPKGTLCDYCPQH
jgi:hypothetical protein